MTALPTTCCGLPGFTIDAARKKGNVLYVDARSTGKVGICPDCGRGSNSIHSYYTRRLRDLPLNICSVWLALTIQRFRCVNVDCRRQTFAEPLGRLAPAFARRTDRLTDALRAIAFSLGGRPGSRLASDLHMNCSPDTLLRIIRGFEGGSFPTPRILGVNGWAQTKQSAYGTILVDLERRRTIELLPDRTAGTLSNWLRLHPGIEVVARG